MASEGAKEEPYASEHAERGSPTDSDNDEGTNVEHNASVTKLLTTQGIRDSNESTNAERRLRKFKRHVVQMGRQASVRWTWRMETARF